MITEVTVYKTPDGRSFLSREAAKEHFEIGSFKEELDTLLASATVDHRGRGQTSDVYSVLWRVGNHIQNNLDQYQSLLNRWVKTRDEKSEEVK